MTDPMDSPRPATAKLHRKLKDRMYRHAEKHGITGFEAAGVMFALAAEVMASALVREGLLQGGPDFAEEGEDATDATDALAASDALADMMPDLQTTINHLVGDTQWLSRRLDKMTERCTDLTEANAQHLARVAGLEEALRAMTVVTAANAQEQLTKEREVLRQSLHLAGQEARITDLLQRCGLTLPTQEPQP
jgi:hypothetical protein